MPSSRLVASWRSEDEFEFVKDLQSKHMIVPVVGDFGGPSAIRRIGDYVRADREDEIHAFYGSNVGIYLTNKQTLAFCRSLATLPSSDERLVHRARRRPVAELEAASLPRPGLPCQPAVSGRCIPRWASLTTRISRARESARPRGVRTPGETPLDTPARQATRSTPRPATHLEVVAPLSGGRGRSRSDLSR